MPMSETLIDAGSYNCALDDLTMWLASHSETAADSVPMQALGDAIASLRKPTHTFTPGVDAE